MPFNIGNAEQWGRSAARCYSFGAAEDELRLLPVPESFMCPMSLGVMLDPVATADGSVYEREQIEKWIRECRQRKRPITSPSTGLVLESPVIMPLAALQKAIETYLMYRPELKESLTMGRSYEEAAQALQNDLFEKEAVRSSMEDEVKRLQDVLGKLSEERDKAKMECARLREALATMQVQSIANTEKCAACALFEQQSSPRELRTEQKARIYLGAQQLHRRHCDDAINAMLSSSASYRSVNSSHIGLKSIHKRDVRKPLMVLEWVQTRRFAIVLCVSLVVCVSLYKVLELSLQHTHIDEDDVRKTTLSASHQGSSELLRRDSQDEVIWRPSLQKEHFAPGGLRAETINSAWGQSPSSFDFFRIDGEYHVPQGTFARIKLRAPGSFPASLSSAHMGTETSLNLGIASTLNLHDQHFEELRFPRRPPQRRQQQQQEQDQRGPILQQEQNLKRHGQHQDDPWSQHQAHQMLQQQRLQQGQAQKVKQQQKEQQRQQPQQQPQQQPKQHQQLQQQQQQPSLLQQSLQQQSLQQQSLPQQSLQQQSLQQQSLQQQSFRQQSLQQQSLQQQLLQQQSLQQQLLGQQSLQQQLQQHPQRQRHQPQQQQLQEQYPQQQSQEQQPEQQQPQQQQPQQQLHLHGSYGLDHGSAELEALLVDHQQQSKFVTSFLQAMEADPQLASIVQYSVGMAISTLPKELQETATRMWQVMTGQGNGESLGVAPEELEAVLQAVLQNIGEVQDMRHVLERMQSMEVWPQAE